MPELPEVQTVVNHIRGDLVGKKILGIIPLWKKSLHNFKPNDLSGENRIIDVRRRAKFIIIDFGEFILAVHLRMTGKLYIQEGSLTPKYTRAIIKLENSKDLIFDDIRKFGRIYLYKNLTEIDSKHGPEPLEKEFTDEWLYVNLKKRSRNLKALLLDQSFIAGLGNIYVDEILWESGIHPNSISSAISKKKVPLLHNSIQNILKKAIDNHGTTFMSFTFLNGRTGNYSNELNIFGKQGEPCKTCGDLIKKIKVAGRGTHICGTCQKKYRPRKK
jgi:formamidopyrimidine-DNA glycosylase